MFEEQGFSAGAFDFVILDNVLEHFATPRESVRAIHRLLSERGRVFIATNNLDEPHGFLWQNFFPDHTITLSPKTLRCLLEVEGFAVVDQNFEGHVTYEGYHYPYQYAVAQKAKVPEEYDFKSKGDDVSSRIEQIRKYVESYYSELGWAKKRYELSLKRDKGFVRRVKMLAYRLLGTILRQNGKFQIRNHTLPPEDYYVRRICVAECRTDDDVKLAIELIQKSGLNPEGFIILRPSGWSEGVKLQSSGSSFLKRKLPSRYENRIQFLDLLMENSLPIGEMVYLVLNKADLRENVIKDTYKIFRQRKEDYGFVDYRMFSNARWEFVKRERLENFRHTEHQIRDLSFFAGDDFDRAIWPQKEDYLYYFKQRFDKYYSIPRTLSLDLAPLCNKQCDKCQFHSPRSPYKHLLSSNQFMEVDLAFKVLRDASRWDPKPSLVPTFSGEPLIYPFLKEVLEYAKKLGFPISITTNGAMLTEERSRYLIDLEIESLVVSVDAFYEDTYSELQWPGRLSDVKENLLRFVEIRGNLKKPNVGVHFLMEKRNQDEFNDFLEFWGDRVDFVSRAIHQDQFSNNGCTLPLWFALGKRRACWSAWTCLYVRWNGNVSFCGFDIGSNLSSLNVMGKTLSEIWNSEEFWRWRDAQLENEFSTLYCKACPDWSSQRSVTLTKDKWKIVRTPLSETYFKTESP
jgi:sulfatase maturation enzyme AslB (radical SAM superfamily)